MTWEYKVLHIDASRWTATGLPPELNEVLDQLGREGWELVRVEPILRGSLFLGCGTATSTVALVAFLKRPKA